MGCLWWHRAKIWALLQYLSHWPVNPPQLKRGVYSNESPLADPGALPHHQPGVALHAGQNEEEQVLTASLSGQQLTSVPTTVLQAYSLQSLDLSRNQLTKLPPEIGHLNYLVSLNLSDNALTSLPPQIGRLLCLEDLMLASNQLTTLPAQIGLLRKLKFLNVMANRLSHLPDELGALTALYRLGLKSNTLTALPSSVGGLRSLVELFLTDNLLRVLPAELGRCSKLVKLQASFNQLTTLPAELAALPRLELMRVAVNNISQIPSELAACPSLAWVSLGGNPVCPPTPRARAQIRKLAIEDLQLGPRLGDGASGDVAAATLDGREVAVKVFKGETSPDGQAADEIAVTCHVEHRNLSRVIAMVDRPHALVLERVFGEPLAQKPDLQNLLRCRWPPGASFPLATIASVGRGVASALFYLHEHNICHGDVYAHNILVDASGNGTLLDYGASFFYEPGTLPYEAQEVRAFGLFLNDMQSRADASADSAVAAPEKLAGIIKSCLLETPAKRPPFRYVAKALAELEQELSQAPSQPEDVNAASQ